MRTLMVLNTYLRRHQFHPRPCENNVELSVRGVLVPYELLLLNDVFRNCTWPQKEVGKLSIKALI